MADRSDEEEPAAADYRRRNTNMTYRRKIAGVLSAAIMAVGGLAGAALAQDFPEDGRAVTAIVPFSAGGGTDAFARLLTPIMSAELGVPVEVINRPGASSQVGLTELANSAADGHTIGFIIFPTSLAYLNPDRQSAYAREDFQAIGPAFEVSSIVAVRADSEYKTLSDLIDAATETPGVVTAGTPGVMSTGHLASLGFQNATEVKFATVNFQGGGPNVTALLGGHVDVSFIAMNEALPRLESRGGDVRVLAVLSDGENPYGLPTAKSHGFDVPSFAPDVGIVAPAGISDAAIEALSNALKAALNDPGVMARAEEIGNSLNFETPAEYTDHWIGAEEKYQPLIDIARGM